MAGRKPSLKKRNTVPRPRDAGRKARRRYDVSNGQVIPIHRRMVMYPKTTGSTWLQKLSWFGGVAFKLFTLLTGVSEDFTASTRIMSSGSTILFGPGDFAAVSPVASKLYTSSDNEVQALRYLNCWRLQSIGLTVSAQVTTMS